MTRLVRVELARYRSRRVIALLLLLAAVVAALVAAKSAWDSRPITAQEAATARANAEMQPESGWSAAGRESPMLTSGAFDHEPVKSGAIAFDAPEVSFVAGIEPVAFTQALFVSDAVANCRNLTAAASLAPFVVAGIM